MATLIMIDGQGRSVPWQANGYFDGDDGGLGNLLDMDRDGRAELLYLHVQGYDRGEAEATSISRYEIQDAHLTRTVGRFAGEMFPMIRPAGAQIRSEPDLTNAIDPGAGGSGPPTPAGTGATVALLASPPVPIPTLNGGNEGQQKAFSEAFKDALQRLNKKKECAGIFGQGAITTLTAANYSFALIEDDEAPGGFAGETTFAVTNPQDNRITINGIGHFFNMVVRKKDQSTGQYDTVQSWLIDNRMTVEQNRTLVLFHELGHLTGVLGDDRKDSKLSGDFNKRIAHDCFGKK